MLVGLRRSLAGPQRWPGPPALGAVFTRAATSRAACVSTPGFCMNPRSRNQSMNRYCHVHLEVWHARAEER